MSSRRRNSKKNLGNSISDIQRRLRRMERKPIRTRLQNRVIKGAAIAPSSITADEVEFGTNIVSTENPEDSIVNPKDGQEVTNPETGGKKVYDESTGEWVDVKDPAAQASADGKNTIYRQDYEPTDGTYVLGDTWFDTNDDNKIYRYSTAITATVTNKQLTSSVATLTVSSAHTFVVGETITVSGVDATFNGSYEVTATPTALTVRYAKNAANVPSTVSTGTITNTAGWKGFALGDGALINISAAKITAGSLNAGVIVTSNLDAGQITTGTLTGRTIRTAASGRRVEMDSSNNALSFYNSSGTALGHIRPATDYAGVIISSGGSATSDFASSAYPKMIMYPAGSDGQFTLILDSSNGGLSFSSSSGIYTATIGVTNTAAVNPFGQRSLREIGFGSATIYPDLSSIISGITGQEGLIVLTYS